MSAKPIAVLDTECYRDYWLLMFKRLDTGTHVAFEQFEGQELDVEKIRSVLRYFTIVSFNGICYDLPMIHLALRRVPCSTLKAASDALIVGEMRVWDFERQFNVTLDRSLDHIDLIEVAPGQASLKLYGGRLHSRKLQDLPIEPDASISPEQRELLKTYCLNDLDTTADLYNKLKPQLSLRTSMTSQYGIDLRSKSDAQIAEAVIKSELQKMTGQWPEKPVVPPGTTFKYNVPNFIRYETPEMRDVLSMVADANFVVTASGKTEMPKQLADAVIPIGKGRYRMGIGGLHSTESCAAHHAKDGYVLLDRDVTSYYPAIILGQRLAPKHMGDNFLRIYRSIVDRRVAAKHAKDSVTADSLKIVVNGSFGKFGSKWSTLYSPHLMIQTTVTGQLSLLMLIEMLETRGIEVVSANTDGVVIKCHESRLGDLERLIGVWEFLTGYDTEETRYKALYSRDVNNYIALKEKGGVKTKGAFASPGLQKNPDTDICSEAVCAFLENGTPIEKTIRECLDIRKFVTVRRVNGGAVVRNPGKDDLYLGKVVRFYYGKNSDCSIHYKMTGNLVPRSQYAVPLMTLDDEFPDDIFYAWYEDECASILREIGWRADA